MAPPKPPRVPHRAVVPPLVASRLTGALALLLAALAGLTLATAGPAQAAPTATAATGDAATLMAARAHDLERVTEAFNAARDQLTAQQTAANSAQARVAHAQAAQAVARQQVGVIARTDYTGHGGDLQALLTSRSAEDFLDQVNTLQTIGEHQTAVLDQAAADATGAAQAQTQATGAAAAAAATYHAVLTQQAALQAQVNQYQADFNQLTAQQQQASVTAADGTAIGDRASRGQQRLSPAGTEPIGPTLAADPATRIALTTALAQLGKPYLWGSSGPGSFDCSGLVQYAFAAAGITLPHSSAAQSRMGQPISRSQLQPGDLIFFYSPVSHVGIYIGNGQMVHAPTSNDVVKIADIDGIGTITAIRRLTG